ncbi:unnamed protein product [Closterium sp. Naga37s-1]|nr:unnamed protein product [Closterium sp. Naga37s-1]
MEASASSSSDAIDALPAALWFQIFQHLHLPPSRPDGPTIHGQRHTLNRLTPWQLHDLELFRSRKFFSRKQLRRFARDTQRGTSDHRAEEGFSAGEQYEKDARAFGASWPLLCCALASKRLLHLVVAFSHISLVYDDQYPQWMQTIRFFLTRPGLHSLDLRFPDPDLLHTPSLAACIARCSSSLTSLRLELQGNAFFSQEEAGGKGMDAGIYQQLLPAAGVEPGAGHVGSEQALRGCPGLKLIRKLTLESVDFKNVNFHFLQSITPQLHEFTLYEEKELSLGPRLASRNLDFSFPNARLLRFLFSSKVLNLTLTVSSTLKTLSVMAKWLVLSCTSTVPLTLDHLSLYGQERLVICSLLLASVRVAYVDRPENVHADLFWTDWLATIAPTVEVLIVPHWVPIKEVNAEWRRLRSLGIVVRTKGRHLWDREATVDKLRTLTDDEFEEYFDEEEFGGVFDYRYIEDEFADEWYEKARARYRVDLEARLRQQQHEQNGFAKPPSIRAPNLRFLFFPSRKACDAATLAALRQDYPALALYCVVDRSFYWERKGASISNGPLEHVRREKSGVLRCWYTKKQQPKNVREKMHSVNRKLAEGYCAEEDEEHAFKYDRQF